MQIRQMVDGEAGSGWMERWVAGKDRQRWVGRINEQMDRLNTSPYCLPGGSVVKNPPASAGDVGSIPDLGRSHRPGSN